ncbi:MAG: helix-turn-helix domain-containing protein [Planctomycetaceae bacterium]
MFTEQLINKRYISVYIGTKDNPLSHTDLLVFSFLGYKDRYGQELPQYQVISERTGLDRNTVSSSVDRLKSHGLIFDNRVCLPDMFRGYFRTRNKNGDHWTDSLTYWKCYVRSDKENPLTVSCASVMSYLWHCIDEDFVPKRGWSISYLASCLKLNRDTVTRCLNTLEDHKFLRQADWQLRGNLQEKQLLCFKNIDDFVSETQNNTLKVVDFDDDDDIAPKVQPDIIRPLKDADADLKQEMLNYVLNHNMCNIESAGNYLHEYAKHYGSAWSASDWKDQLIKWHMEHQLQRQQ